MSRQPPSTFARNSATPLEWVLFIALCGLLAVRPLIPESFSDFDLPFAEGSLGPTRAATVWLDWLTLLISTIAMVRSRCLSRAAIVGCGLLIAAAVFSTVAAEEKRVALNASGTLVTMTFSCLALLRLVRGRAHANMLVAAITATCALNAGKCFQQRGYEFADTLEDWQKRKMELAQRGEDVLDPLYTNFERRMQSQNAYGYVAHPNIAASIMMMGAVAAAGVAIGGLRRAGNARLISVIGGCAAACTMSAGVYFTGSKGALVAGAIGIGVIAILDRCITKPRSRFVTVALVCIGSFAGMLGWGLAKGTLPSESLAFRWEYWTAAAHALPDAGFSGLGRENFVAAHMRYKPATATEEVRNPHNLWVSLFWEMGLLGLLAGIVLLGGAARRLGFVSDDRPGDPQSEAPRFAVIALAAVVPILHACFSGSPLLAPGVELIWVIEIAGAWCVLYGLLFALLHKSDFGPRTFATIGLGVFCSAILHNLIDFSLLMPSGLAAFVALMAAARDQEECTDRRRSFVALSICSGVLVAAYFVAIVYPTSSVESLNERAKERIRAARSPSDLEAANVLFLAASAADSLDSDVPRRAATRFFGMAQRADTPADWSKLWLAHAEHFALLAQMRAPDSYSTVRLLARMADQQRDAAMASQSRDEEQLARRAAENWEQAISRYPTNALDRIDAAYAQIAVWKITQSDRTVEKAIRHLDTALQIDKVRPSENASKLRIQEMGRIRDGLHLLLSATTQGATTSAPQTTSAPTTAPSP